MYKFEKLRVYNDALDLIIAVYKLLEQLPHNEKFVLVDQGKRAVISIVLNIAEGTGSLGDKEFKSFLRNSLKSLFETVAVIKIIEKIYKLNTNIILEKCDKIGKQINALINSLSKD